jgi:hypothetical protein
MSEASDQKSSAITTWPPRPPNFIHLCYKEKIVNKGKKRKLNLKGSTVESHGVKVKGVGGNHGIKRKLMTFYKLTTNFTI